MKLKQLLTGIISMAMVSMTLTVPAFADDGGTITFNQFVQNVKDGNGTYDGNGVTVAWQPVTGCYQLERTHTCTAGEAAATAETPMRVNSDLAQFQIFDGLADLNISNVNFKFTPAAFTVCENSDWACSITTIDKAHDAELHLYNSGNTTFTNCSFDKAVLTPYNYENKYSNRTATITGCTFTNIYNSYAMKDIQCETVIIKNNTFKDCGAGVMLSGAAAKNVEISGNTFTNVDAEGTAPADKVGTRGLIQVASSYKFDDNASFSVTDNTSTSDAPVFRILNTTVSKITYKDNTVPETAAISTGDTKIDEDTIKNKILVEDEQTEAVAKIGDTGYATLEAAFAAVGEKETINLLCDASGNGIQVKGGKNFTVDFGGHTYTVDGTLVGSSGSETNGFQLLAGSDITFKNGTIKVSAAAQWGPNTPNVNGLSGSPIFIQNYCNLTLDGMTINGIPDDVTVANKQWVPLYVLSNNNADTVITGNTNIIAGTNRYAFDVCSFADYPHVTVKLDKNMTGTISGNIEFSNDKTVYKKDFDLIIEAGTINGKIVDSRKDAQKEHADFGTITGGTFSDPKVAEYIDSINYKTVETSDGKYQVATREWENDTAAEVSAVITDATEKLAETMENSGFVTEEGTSTRGDQVKLSAMGNATKAKMSYSYDGKLFDVVFDLGDIIAEGDVTFGVLLYNIPDVSKLSAAPEVSLLK